MEVAQIQYIDRVVDVPVCAEYGDSFATRGLCVPKPVTSEISWFPGLNSSGDSEGEVGIKVIRCGG